MTSEERDSNLSRRHEYYRKRRATQFSEASDTFFTRGSGSATSYAANVDNTTEDERVVGRGQLTQLLRNPFNSSTNFHEGSTSRVTTTNISGNRTIVQRDEDSDASSYSSEEEHLTDARNLYNIARDFKERAGFVPLQLTCPRIRQHCQAKLFDGETKSFCCKGGKVKLPEILFPTELKRMFS